MASTLPAARRCAPALGAAFGIAVAVTLAIAAPAGAQGAAAPAATPVPPPPPEAAPATQTFRLASPDGRNVVTVALRAGQLQYGVARNGQPVLLPSRLGFAFRGARPLVDGLRVVDSARTRYDSTFALPWGEVARVRDQHTELRVRVQETAAPNRTFVAVFRAFDDGVAFRYELPQQPALGAFEVADELTEFAMADNARAWSIPANVPWADRQEMLYAAGPVSRLDTVQTPLTMQTASGTQVVIHEADLEDYAGLYLVRAGEGNHVLHAGLARWKDGTAVKGRTPFVTPWRTVQLADRPADLAPSVLGLKLNPPSRIANTSWIRPMTYDGIWWGMHLGTMTWSSGPKHGATTANTRRYIDFAAANKLGGTLVEGWNVGWDGDWTKNGAAFSFTRAYPDYDLAGLAAYARSKGVALIAHNETATNVGNYDRQLDSAFALYHRLGITALKTGYVGDTTERGDAHQSQAMVRHHRRVIETAAKYGIMVDAHEPIHDTGERRTWPNMMSREGARGQEYNAWSTDGGNPPEHESILFFTRLLSGPMDFTPGIFDVLESKAVGGARRPDQPRVRTTVAKQLALYVVLYSPVQMAADLPENYAGRREFQFIRDVAVDWDTTRVLDGRIGDYVVVARKARGRDEWFLGAITDEEARTLDAPLAFLTPGRRYVAEVYADGPGANWRDNPLPVAISRQPVDATTRLRMVLAPGGGQAVRIRPAG